jgi:hypothetical protein
LGDVAHALTHRHNAPARAAKLSRRCFMGGDNGATLGDVALYHTALKIVYRAWC